MQMRPFAPNLSPHAALGRGLTACVPRQVDARACDSDTVSLGAAPSVEIARPVPPSASTLRAALPEPVALRTAASLVGGPLGYALADERAALAVLFTKGEGPTDGLRAPELATDLLAARKAGATFLGGGMEAEPMTPAEAYEALLSPHPQASAVYLGLEGVQMVACRRDTVRSGIEAFTPLAQAHREVLRRGRFDAYAMQCAVDRLAGPLAVASPMRHAAFLVDLYDRIAASRQHAASPNDAGNALARAYDTLAPRLDTWPAEDMQQVLTWTQRGGADETRKAAEHRMMLDGPDREAFATAMGAMGNAAAAAEAVACVNAEGPASRAARLAALERLCALYANAPAGDDALKAWQSVSDAHAPDASLGVVTDRFIGLQRLLAARGQEDRTRDCFAQLERAWRARGDQTPEPVYLRFADHLQRTGRAEVTDIAAATTAPALVERREDAVRVGGIWIPVRRDG